MGKEIAKLKSMQSLKNICQDIPGSSELIKYFEYVKSLKFDDEPDYLYLEELIENMLMDQQKKQKVVEFRVDWYGLYYKNEEEIKPETYKGRRQSLNLSYVHKPIRVGYQVHTDFSLEPERIVYETQLSNDDYAVEAYSDNKLEYRIKNSSA